MTSPATAFANPLYGIVGHPLLIAKAAALPPDKLTQQGALAEMLLDLVAPALTDSAQIARATLGVVLQVNYQVEMGIDPYTVASVSSPQSGQSVQYHRGQIAAPLPVHTQARLLVSDLVAGRAAARWGALPSFRPVRRFPGSGERGTQ